MAVSSQPQAGRIINLADQNQFSQGGVEQHAAVLSSFIPPVPQPLGEAHLSPSKRSSYRTRRHIESQVIKPELDVDLINPNYKVGFAAILEVEKPIN